MKYILLQCLLIWGGISYAQAQPESLEEIVESYLSAIETENYELLASHLDHRIFSDVTSEELAEGVIAAMTGDDAMPMKISNSSFIGSGEMIHSAGNKYVPVKISFTMQVPFIGDFTEMVVENLKISYGEDNVQVDEKNELITAVVEEYIVGRFDEEENAWKIFNPEIMYFSDFISEDLQNAIMEQISTWKLEKMLAN